MVSTESLAPKTGHLSGVYWVKWARTNLSDSNSTNDLKQPFKDNLLAFKKALEDAGATVEVNGTRRSPKKVYLFYWSWQIKIGKCKPSDVPPMEGIDIIWDHGNARKSIIGATEIVEGFEIVSEPSLTTNHAQGLACDMTIKWSGTINVKKKNGGIVKVMYYWNVDLNNELIKVGESYNVYKLIRKTKPDYPHWSYNGH